MLVDAIVDYANLGVKRHRRWCSNGKDWQVKKRRGGPSFVPKIYQEVRKKVEFLYSPLFYHIAAELKIHPTVMQELFLRLMAGPND